MATVLFRGLDEKKTVTESTTSLGSDAPPLGAPKEEKRFWFQRTKDFDENAIATQVMQPKPSSAQPYNCH